MQWPPHKKLPSGHTGTQTCPSLLTFILKSLLEDRLTWFFAHDFLFLFTVEFCTHGIKTLCIVYQAQNL